MSHPGSDQWRHDHWGTPCNPKLVGASIGDVIIRVEDRAVVAFRALDAVIDHFRYGVRPAYPDGDTGAYNCRHIGSDPNRPWSAHAWGIAIDINWRDNPDGSRLQHNFPPGFIDAVHAIRTVEGVPVWKWGGDWDRDPNTAHSYYDAMHFEVIATPTQLAAGIDPATLPPQEDDVITKHSPEALIEQWQHTVSRLLFESGGGWEGGGTAHERNGSHLKPDGVWGTKTQDAVVEALKRTEGVLRHPLYNPDPANITGITYAFVADAIVLLRNPAATQESGPSTAELDERYAPAEHAHDERYAGRIHPHKVTVE